MIWQLEGTFGQQAKSAAAMAQQPFYRPGANAAPVEAVEVEPLEPWSVPAVGNQSEQLESVSLIEVDGEHQN